MTHSLFLLPIDPDVELSAPSLVPCPPVDFHTSFYKSCYSNVVPSSNVNPTLVGINPSLYVFFYIPALGSFS